LNDFLQNKQNQANQNRLFAQQQMNNAFGQNNNGNVMKKIDFDQNGPNNFSPPRNLPLPISPPKNLPPFQPSFNTNFLGNGDLSFSTPQKNRTIENNQLRNRNNSEIVLKTGGNGIGRYPLGVNPNSPQSSPLSKALAQNAQLGQNRYAVFNP
jgi:hypothetical protein